MQSDSAGLIEIFAAALAGSRVGVDDRGHAGCFVGSAITYQSCYWASAICAEGEICVMTDIEALGVKPRGSAWSC